MPSTRMGESMCEFEPGRVMWMASTEGLGEAAGGRVGEMVGGIGVGGGVAGIGVGGGEVSVGVDRPQAREVMAMKVMRRNGRVWAGVFFMRVV